MILKSGQRWTLLAKPGQLKVGQCRKGLFFKSSEVPERTPRKVIG